MNIFHLEKRIVMKKIVILLLVLLFLSSCAAKHSIIISQVENQDHLLLPVLWFQKSAEMKALYYQGYNIAQRSLLEIMETQNDNRPYAVLMDIDETVLDNSPAEAYQVKNNVPFSDQIWETWVNKASAEPCPGALGFTKFAESVNVEIFYVSNRESPEEYGPTMENLRLCGFPFADSTHLVLKTDESSKESRRKTISEKYDILMLIGDNLADFDAVFDNRGDDLGFEAVARNVSRFGTDFIILPNPMYGPWINASIKDQTGHTMREKIINVLRAF
jgi:5'-nucleotidase (lipoprotein e(P4) family)